MLVFFHLIHVWKCAPHLLNNISIIISMTWLPRWEVVSTIRMYLENHSKSNQHNYWHLSFNRFAVLIDLWKIFNLNRLGTTRYEKIDHYAEYLDVHCRYGYIAGMATLQVRLRCRYGYVAGTAMLQVRLRCRYSYIAGTATLQVWLRCRYGYVAGKVTLQVRLRCRYGYAAGTAMLQVRLHCRYGYVAGMVTLQVRLRCR